MQTKTYYFSASITCGSCVAIIENSIRASEKFKVKGVAASIDEKQIAVEVYEDVDLLPKIDIRKELIREVENLGFSCVDIGTPAERIRSHLIKGVIGTISGVAMLSLCLCGLGSPLVIMGIATGISALITLVLGAESYRDAIIKLFKSKTLTMDSLFTVSTLTALGVSLASLFINWLPMMLDTGLFIFGFRHLGKALEESAQAKVTAHLNFKNRAAREVILVNQQDINDQRLIDTASIKLNDIIILKKGQIIPFDGLCLSDSAYVYKTLFNGSTLPSTLNNKVHYNQIYAGMQVASEVLEMKVTALEKDSRLAHLDEELMNAQMKKAPIVSKTQVALQYFVPTVFCLAALSGLVIGILFNPALAIQCAVSVLVIACPCTLGLITPLAIKIGMTKAIDNGVQFKSGQALQAAAEVDTVAFDLNGTLTRGVPSVTDCKLNSEFLDYIALLEAQSQHPIAQAIHDYANKNKTEKRLDLIITNVDTSHHCGVKATITTQLKGHTTDEIFMVGNEKMMTAHGLIVPEIAESTEYVTYLAKGNKIVGYLLLADSLRPDAIETVTELKRQGKQVYLITGSEKRTAEFFAQKLGIAKENIAADCVSQKTDSDDITKGDCILKLKDSGAKVCMVGEGGNDAIAMTKSHFSIAVKSNFADEVTKDNAGAIVQNDSLLPVLTTLVVAKQTVNNIKMNLILNLTYNSAAVLLPGILTAIGFSINPAIGVVLMVSLFCISLLIANQLKNEKLPHLRKPKAHLQPRLYAPKRSTVPINHWLPLYRI